MTYIIIGIAAIVIIGGVSYLIYRRRVTQPSTVPEEEAPAVNPELPETAPEAASVAVAETPETVPEVKEAPPIVSEPSSLPEDAKNKLMNAIWYRCENPYCNYTQFLDVHHIVPEANGGTNRLDNLLVLCSRCHALADNNEIPEEVMSSWIKERTERFKTELDWPYK